MTEANLLFGRSFDLPADDELEARFTDDDLATARQEGFADGRIAGVEEARASDEGRIVVLAKNLTADLAALASQDDERRQTISQDCAHVIRAVCERAVPTFAQHEAVNEIIGIVVRCLATQTDEPRIVIRVSNELADAVQARLDAASAQAGFPGALVLIPDETLGNTDCSVLWADGGAERYFTKIWSEIELVLDRVLGGGGAGPPPTPQPVSPLGASDG